MENLAPVPDFLVEQGVTNQRITGRVTTAMRYWLLSLVDRVNASPLLLAKATVTEKSSAIVATNFQILSVQPGVYRLSMSARITRAASTSSSLIVTFGWTQAVSCSASSVAMTGNTTATVGSLTVLAKVDIGTPITYATSVASSGGTTMQYCLDVICEQIV